MLEDVIAWDKDGVGHPKKCMDNEEAIESLQQQINALELSLEPAIVINNMELNARVLELEEKVADLVSAVELLLKRL